MIIYDIICYTCHALKAYKHLMMIYDINCCTCHVLQTVKYDMKYQNEKKIPSKKSDFHFTFHFDISSRVLLYYIHVKYH